MAPHRVLEHMALRCFKMLRMLKMLKHLQCGSCNHTLNSFLVRHSISRPKRSQEHQNNITERLCPCWTNNARHRSEFLFGAKICPDAICCARAHGCIRLVKWCACPALTSFADVGADRLSMSDWMTSSTCGENICA